MYKEAWKDDVFCVHSCVKLITHAIVFDIGRIIYTYRSIDTVAQINTMVSGPFVNGLVGEMHATYMIS